jgi:hypothetical protein
VSLGQEPEGLGQLRRSPEGPETEGGGRDQAVEGALPAEKCG